MLISMLLMLICDNLLSLILYGDCLNFFMHVSKCRLSVEWTQLNFSPYSCVLIFSTVWWYYKE